MTQPTIAQLHNLINRAGAGLTADEQQRLRDGIGHLHERAETADEAARRALAQRQEMAEERYAWQERGDRAETALACVRTARDRIAHASNVDAIWCLDQLDDALAEPDPVATQATEPATSPLRDLIAAAIYERNNPAHRWADAHPDDLLAYGFDADAVLAVILPATRITATLARMSDADVQRVIALYERWVKAGPPPLGTSINRWWDKRLAELNAALNPKGN